MAPRARAAVQRKGPRRLDAKRAAPKLFREAGSDGTLAARAAGGPPAAHGPGDLPGHDRPNQGTAYVTGAILGVLPPERELPPPWKRWRKLDVLLEGDRRRLEIDGILIPDPALNEGPELRHRLRPGPIGFPGLGHRFALRNKRIEDLGAPTKFSDLVKGGSRASWALRDGAVEGSNSHGILSAPGLLGGFESTAAVRSHQGANAGVFVRGDATGPRRGFEVRIDSPADAVRPTGSI